MSDSTFNEPILVARWAAAVALNLDDLLPSNYDLAAALPDTQAREAFATELNQRTVQIVNQLSNFTIGDPFSNSELRRLSTGAELITMIRAHLLPKPSAESWRCSSRLPLPISEDDSGWTAL